MPPGRRESEHAPGPTPRRRRLSTRLGPTCQEPVRSEGAHAVPGCAPTTQSTASSDDGKKSRKRGSEQTGGERPRGEKEILATCSCRASAVRTAGARDGWRRIIDICGTSRGASGADCEGGRCAAQRVDQRGRGGKGRQGDGKEARRRARDGERLALFSGRGVRDAAGRSRRERLSERVICGWEKSRQKRKCPGMERKRCKMKGRKKKERTR
ncbi:hypothetical protein FA95DRAFT_1256835 [Auriscalpium vulgare]|uniref:Uncharacterized protein n=1 Tax=Auriscalpium vulgare TaxID=40419 RepID=A0ACB8S930_9AGAM|nr:hypothetical protein FA95DRAFT_1256835 [Auriscalpium vulgare]